MACPLLRIRRQAVRNSCVQFWAAQDPQGRHLNVRFYSERRRTLVERVLALMIESGLVYSGIWVRFIFCVFSRCNFRKVPFPSGHIHREQCIVRPGLTNSHHVLHWPAHSVWRESLGHPPRRNGSDRCTFSSPSQPPALLNCGVHRSIGDVPDDTRTPYDL